MFKTIINTLKKKKIQHFLYVHLLFFCGIVALNISFNELLFALFLNILIVSPVSSVITHSKLKHDYYNFKNDFFEWLALIYICVFSFWKIEDSKSYHIQHHKAWLTDKDPTGSEIAQGKVNYYIGTTVPCAIEKMQTKDNEKIKFINKYFYHIKILFYILFLFVSIKLFFLIIVAQQFYGFVLYKLHDIIFHQYDYENQYSNKPWLFFLYWNDAWHIDHHVDYTKPEKFYFKWANPHYYISKIFFKDVDIALYK